MGVSLRRVFLHVGGPKTGTTYLQARLRANARALAGHGVHIPIGRAWRYPAALQFRAALDLIEDDWDTPRGYRDGAWPELLRNVRRSRGHVVISHEVLAAAPAGAVARAFADLGKHEIHVVYTARDLARQLPGAWQEGLKHGRSRSFARFLEASERGDTWFMEAWDIPRVFSTWGADLPTERLHLVTVPPSGSDPELLWTRFCEAIDVDPAWAPRDTARTNDAVGVPEAQLLRELNRRLGPGPARAPRFNRLVRRTLIEPGMTRDESPSVSLPPSSRAWVDRRAESWVTWARERGLVVHGDLADLVPAPVDPDATWVDPDTHLPRQVELAATDALVTVLEDVADQGQRGGELRRRLAIARRHLRR